MTVPAPASVPPSGSPSAAVSAAARWDDLLRALAEVIDQQRAALLAMDLDAVVDVDTIELPSLDLPDDMPPLPDEFAPWAASLARDTAGLAELAQAMLDRHPLTPVRRHRGFATASSTSSMDQKI